VLRAAEETETAQENIQKWLELDEGDPGIQFLTEGEIASVIFFFVFVFISINKYIIKFSIYLFSKFFLSYKAIFCLINLDYCLITMASPPN
jgi:hypothetical protein